MGEIIGDILIITALVLLAAIPICIISLLIYSIIKKKIKLTIVMGVLTVFVCGAALFFSSHKTDIRYNDWWIIGNNINTVQSRYGDFYTKSGNKAVISPQGGSCSYYLGKTSDFFLDSPKDTYYTICYDKNGIVYDVYLSGPAGG